MVDAGLLAHDAAAAHRARRGHAEVRHVARPLLPHAADDLGDDVAGAPDDDLVADAHALPAHLEEVVQGRVRNRRSADEDRLELGHRRELAGATDLDLDRLEPRRLLLRRVLLRDRPPRLARLEAEPLLQRAVVDLVDDAVDVGAARRAWPQPLRETRPALRHHARNDASGSPAFPSRRSIAAACRRDRPAHDFAKPVREEVERALGGIAHREAHDAGGGVARIDEDLPFFAPASASSGAVEPRTSRCMKTSPRTSRTGAETPLQPLGNRGDRAHRVTSAGLIATRRRLTRRLFRSAGRSPPSNFNSAS